MLRSGSVTPLIVPGSAHRALAQGIATELGAELAACTLERFPDGEQEVAIQARVRGRPVFIVQPLGQPVGENLLDLLLLADASHRAGALSTQAIVPYLGYARHDRVKREGQPLAAKVVAEALGTGPFTQLLALDLHSAVVAACIRAPLCHLTAVGTLALALAPELRANSIVVSPDLGAVKLAEAFARSLDLPLAVVHKNRISGSEVAVTSVMGEVRGKRPVLVDDLIATGGTLDAAIDALLGRGCLPEITVVATHGLFVGEAVTRLSRPEIALALTTDSLPSPARLPPSHRVISVAPLLADAVRRLEAGRSLDDLLAAR
jgi:ribose-phosphate pyrophosphokinase